MDHTTTVTKVVGVFVRFSCTRFRQFNVRAKLGASADTAMDLYLRPETAQGIL
jgi:glycyl-tRNA synthetase (class II)